MEEQAPYQPQSPRNLAPDVAAWLRKQDFTATEHERPGAMTVLACYVGPQQERFELTYAWVGGSVPSATCWLTVRYPGQPQVEALFTAQHVRRVSDVRRLVGNCVRLANARLLASLAHPVR